MKNKIILLSAIIGLLSAGSAGAATVDVDFLKEQFVVSGRLNSGEKGQEIQIMVLNPGMKAKDAEGDNYKAAIQQVAITESSEDGEYVFELPILMKGEKEGYYTFYIETPGEEKLEVLTRYYADADVRKDIIDRINNATETEMQNILEAAKEPLSLSCEVFDKCDKAELAELVYKAKEKKPYSKEEMYKTQLGIRQLALVAAYNKGMAELCFSEDGGFNFSDIIDMSENDKDGVTLYKVYEEIISESGRKKIREKLLNSGYSTVEELYNEFAELSYVFGVKYAATEGTGHIKSVITAENSKRVGVNADKYISVSGSSKRSLMEAELLNQSFETSGVMIETLNGIIDKYNVQVNTGGGGTGGGSQGSTSTGGVVPVAGMPIQTGSLIEEAVFEDIEGTAWAKDAILYLYNKGIVKGTGEKSFSPGRSITREQFAVILANAAGYQLNDGETAFSDVLRGSYYEKHIIAALEHGIVKGVSETEFGVGKNISRQDLCVMIYRAWFDGKKGENPPVFTDSEGISEYARDAVSYLAELGIVNGFEDGSFRAGEACTRAQGAKIIYEVLKLKQ